MVYAGICGNKPKKRHMYQTYQSLNSQGGFSTPNRKLNIKQF